MMSYTERCRRRGGGPKPTAEHLPCTGRLAYGTADEANGARVEYFLPENFRPYKCQHCRKWHLTTMPADAA